MALHAIAGALALLLVVTAGCDGDAEKPAEKPTPDKQATKAPTKKGGTEPEGPAGTGGDPTRDPQLLANKIGPYLGCVNATRQAVARHYKQYNTRVKGDGRLRSGAKGPPPAEPPDTGLKACEKAIREGRHLTPRLADLEETTVDYTERVREYGALAGQATAAIGKRDAAAVKDVHERLVAAYDSWDNTSIQLTTLLDNYQKTADTELLKRVEARAGKGVEYHARAMLIAARGFAQCLTSLDLSGGCVAPLGELERTHDALTEASGDDKAAAVKGFAEFAASAKAYREASATLSNDLRKKPKSRPEARIPDALALYNALVKDGGGLEVK